MHIRTLVLFISFVFISAEQDIQSRVVGGSEAKPHQFPFLVSITLVPTGDSYCGGSIIAKRWVLTAAHCIFNYDYEDVAIIAGKHDLSIEEPGQQTRKPQEFYLHPRFNPYAIGPNDIGLIYLTESFIFSQTVQPIELPKKNTIPSGFGEISGWGSISRTVESDFPTRVQTATVSVLDHNTCAKALKDMNYATSNICTGPLSGSVGHCGGDSGGPFVQNINGRTLLVGVISWAYTPCGTPNIPPALGRVSYFVGWIQETMNKVK